MQLGQQQKLFGETDSLCEDELRNIEFSHRGYEVNSLNKSLTSSKTHAISLFSGAGGLDIGVQLSGVRVISSLDFDKDSVATMRENEYFRHTEHQFDNVENISGLDYSSTLKKSNPEKCILVGGPPCQPFSKAGYWVTHKNILGENDPRNMIGNYLRLIQELEPDGFVLENVESILHPKNISVVDKLKEAIDILGYSFIVYKANAIDFGVPQKRKRVFFIASKKKLIGEPTRTHGSPKEIIFNDSLLPHEKVVDWIGRYDDPSYFEDQEVTEGKTYSNELRAVPPGKNYIALTEKAGYPNPKFVANKRFWSFLLKLHPNLPSWTIAAQPGPWVGPFHWSSRRLRVPEIAAIQTFPEDYIFVGSRRSIQKQIGNAVPPLLGKSIVEYLLKNL